MLLTWQVIGVDHMMKTASMAFEISLAGIARPLILVLKVREELRVY